MPYLGGGNVTINGDYGDGQQKKDSPDRISHSQVSSEARCALSQKSQFAYLPQPEYNHRLVGLCRVAAFAGMNLENSKHAASG
jgi:hypothetical protein